MRVRSEQLSPSAEQVFQRSQKPPGRPRFPLLIRVVSGPPPAAQVNRFLGPGGAAGVAASAGVGRAAARAWTLRGARPSAGREAGGGGRDSPSWPSGFGSSLADLRGAEPRCCCSGLPRLGGLGAPTQPSAADTGKAGPVRPPGLPWVRLPRPARLAGSPPLTRVCSWPRRDDLFLSLSSVLRPFLCAVPGGAMMRGRQWALNKCDWLWHGSCQAQGVLCGGNAAGKAGGLARAGTGCSLLGSDSSWAQFGCFLRSGPRRQPPARLSWASSRVLHLVRCSQRKLGKLFSLLSFFFF